MIPMKCTKELVYGGRRLKPGAIFEAVGESDARVLEAIKKAERVKAVVPQVAPIDRPFVAAEKNMAQHTARTEVAPAATVAQEECSTVESEELTAAPLDVAHDDIQQEGQIDAEDSEIANVGERTEVARLNNSQAGLTGKTKRKYLRRDLTASDGK